MIESPDQTALNEVLAALKPLTPEEQRRVLSAVETFYNIPPKQRAEREPRPQVFR